MYITMAVKLHMYIFSDILKRGGNAADVAVAMAPALAVAEPSSIGAGGDAFCFFYEAKVCKGCRLIEETYRQSVVIVHLFWEALLGSFSFESISEKAANKLLQRTRLHTFHLKTMTSCSLRFPVR